MWRRSLPSWWGDFKHAHWVWRQTRSASRRIGMYWRQEKSAAYFPSSRIAGAGIETNPCRAPLVYEAVSRCLPINQGMKPVGVWRSLRPFVPDGLPLLGGLHPRANASMAEAHGTKKVSLGPVTGKLVSGRLNGNPLEELERPLDPYRF
jgi:glycine/D-amino acid oxidase-like deaminating enzyme